MFSYTDDAIVTSSPTGRHLSTVIRRPAAIGPFDWSEHAEQVCKVLNELDRNTRVCYSLGAGFQTVGRVRRDVYIEEAHVGNNFENPFGVESEQHATEPTFASVRIAELEKQLDDATTKLTAAQMLLEKPIEVTEQLAALLYHMPKGAMAPFNNRTFKRVE